MYFSCEVYGADKSLSQKLFIAGKAERREENNN
jgi:hypothetical protein